MERLSFMNGITQIKSNSKCDIVVNEILAKIVRGEYKEGDRLPPESTWIEALGVSRVTVREAFKKLNAIGVVSIRQGKGSFVNQIDLGTLMKPLFSLVVFDSLSINQIYDARLYIEAGNASLASINRTEDELASLKDLIDRMRVAVREYDEENFTELDSAFHMTIGEASKNAILLGAYTTIRNILKGYIRRTNYSREAVKTSLDYHIKIVELIEAGNAQRAGEVMKIHIEASKQFLLAQLQKDA